jgi:hypothetical protein
MKIKVTKAKAIWIMPVVSGKRPTPVAPNPARRTKIENTFCPNAFWRKYAFITTSIPRAINELLNMIAEG